jgi:hypothetical protein
MNYLYFLFIYFLLNSNFLLSEFLIAILKLNIFNRIFLNLTTHNQHNQRYMENFVVSNHSVCQFFM